MTLQILEWLNAKTESKNNFEVSLGDTLDVKASILLLIITFLATFAAAVLSSNYEPLWRYAQIASLFFLMISSFYSIGALWPREYTTSESIPEDFIAWVENLDSHWKEQKPEQNMFEYILLDEMRKTARAERENKAINVDKIRLLKRSFWTMLLVLAIDLIVAIASAEQSLRPLFSLILGR